MREQYLRELKTCMQNGLLEYAMADLPATPDQAHLPALWRIHDDVERLINAIQQAAPAEAPAAPAAPPMGNMPRDFYGYGTSHAWYKKRQAERQAAEKPSEENQP